MTHIRANNLDFSSLFSVDQEDVNQRFAQACETLDISSWRLHRGLTIGDTYAALLKVPSKTNVIGPEGSIIINVPGDGNCLFSSLLDPLLGYVPGQVLKLV